jgi:hypothetical protein
VLHTVQFSYAFLVSTGATLKKKEHLINRSLVIVAVITLVKTTRIYEVDQFVFC